MEIITRLMLTASVSLLVGLCLPLQCQCSPCTPPDTRWYQYTPSLPPMVFNGSATTGGCSVVCIGPGFTFGLPPATLGDGEHGTTTLNVTAVHAWSNDVSIEFSFPSGTSATSVRVFGINLYFYNIPSMNIGLPYNTVLYSATSSVSSTIEGNQDLSQDDNQLRIVTLIPTSPFIGTSFNIGFTFSSRDKIDWLLLTEVEICTFGIVITPNTAAIIFTGDTVNSVSPTTVNSTISLSCSVENEGRFMWSWTLPSGGSVSPTFILDTGRTSVLELSQVTSGDSGDYKCSVDYTGLASDSGLSTMFTVALSLTGVLERDSDMVYVDKNDLTATLSCELYDYLSPGEPLISWLKGETTLTNDTTYTITIETGDRHIQNGGNQIQPSLKSVLTINLMNNPVNTSQTFSCQTNSIGIGGLQNITVSGGLQNITLNNGGMTRIQTPTYPTLPIAQNTFVGVIAFLCIVIVILLAALIAALYYIFWKHKSANGFGTTGNRNVELNVRAHTQGDVTLESNEAYGEVNRSEPVAGVYEEIHDIVRYQNTHEIASTIQH